MFFVSSTHYTISGIYILAVGNTPYGKRHTSRTILVSVTTPLQSKLTFTAIFLVLLTDQFDAFLTRKTPQRRTNATNNTPPT